MRKTNGFTCKTIGFTRKTQMSADRVIMNLLHVKPIVLRVKPFVLRVKQKYYYILMYCFTRKVNFLRVKHLINDPFGHKLQITLINETMALHVKHYIVLKYSSILVLRVKHLVRLRLKHLTLRVKQSFMTPIAYHSR